MIPRINCPFVLQETYPEGIIYALLRRQNKKSSVVFSNEISAQEPTYNVANEAAVLNCPKIKLPVRT